MTCRNLILGGVCNELTKSILGCADHRAAGAYAGRVGRYLAGDIQSTDGIAENGRRVQANGRADSAYHYVPRSMRVALHDSEGNVSSPRPIQIF